MAIKKLDNFNTLQPKPEHLKKVISVMERRDAVKVVDFVQMTGLSKTQVLCALNALVQQGAVTQQESPLRFTLVRLVGAPD